MIRIRVTGGTGQARIATGQNKIADTAMPTKKIAERSQIIFVAAQGGKLGVG